jgi:hypothetical protein
MRKLIAILVAAIFVAPNVCSEGFADDVSSKAALQQVLESTVGCQVTRTDSLPLLVSPKIPSQWGTLRVIGVETEECDGGNNYQYTVHIFDTSQEQPLKVQLDGLSLAWIEKIFMSEKRGVPNITIVAPEYAPEDGRCCPSLMQEIRIWAEAGSVEWKQIRHWKKK